MGFAALTFLLILTIVLGSYWAVVVRPEGAARSAMRRRLRTTTKKAKAHVVALEKETTLSDIPAFSAVLRQSQTLTNRIQGLIDRSGLNLTVGKFLLMSACSGMGAYLLVALTTRTILLALAVGLVASWVPYLYVRHKANQRMNRFEEIFPEAIGLIVRALRAGHAFTTGIAMAAEEMSDPVGPEFRLVYDHQNFGMPMEDALKRLAERMPLLDVRFFVTAVLTQRDAGGNLAEILENITSVIRDRFKVKRQVRVVTAHARISGLVLAGMPPACALVVSVIAPSHMKILFTDPLGIRMVIVAIVLQILGALMIRKLVDIEY